eukprot:TRINITY_DN65977_c0_g1_i1.p1 TRINITY_DN65977_c0_g1~~TRINITY_DN65977_c0_g1_i1.p1  ORF type:complete len:334 (+),score=49.28 TRINITY_DN65977_c0_g1_i1:59-1060(+)
MPAIVLPVEEQHSSSGVVESGSIISSGSTMLEQVVHLDKGGILDWSEEAPSKWNEDVDAVCHPYSSDGAVMKCGCLSDWLRDECEAFQGMAVVRRENRWDHFQSVIDQLYESGGFGLEVELSDKVPVCRGTKQVINFSRLETQLDECTQKLLSQLILPPGVSFPPKLANLIRNDAVEIGAVLAKLVPDILFLIVKLELIRENSCKRWHQDSYVCRAIVTYNGASTEYIHDDYVDFWELENCGNNDCVVKSRTSACNAGVGNILFIKGKLFPTLPNGLVHKSPDHLYHDHNPEDEDGQHDSTKNIVTRLVLKVDIPAEAAQNPRRQMKRARPSQ